jgi:hypothetical protein
MQRSRIQAKLWHIIVFLCGLYGSSLSGADPQIRLARMGDQLRVYSPQTGSSNGTEVITIDLTGANPTHIAIKYTKGSEQQVLSIGLSNDPRIRGNLERTKKRSQIRLANMRAPDETASVETQYAELVFPSKGERPQLTPIVSRTFDEIPTTRYSHQTQPQKVQPSPLPKSALATSVVASQRRPSLTPSSGMEYGLSDIPEASRCCSCCGCCKTTANISYLLGFFCCCCSETRTAILCCPCGLCVEEEND